MIRKIHSHDFAANVADIATQYDDLFFDDTNNILLVPDPKGLIRIPLNSNTASSTTTTATTTSSPPVVGGAVNPMYSPVATTTAMKGYIAAYCNAGVFLTLDNLKFSVTTSGQRGLCCATVSGTVTLSISASYALAGGASGYATSYPGATYTTTPSTSWFGWSFPNAGDGSTYLCNDYTNQRVYRVNLQIGPGYAGNFISIERLM